MYTFDPPFVALPPAEPTLTAAGDDLDTPPVAQWPTYALNAQRWTPDDTDRRWPGEEDAHWLRRCYLAALEWAREDAAVEQPASKPPKPARAPRQPKGEPLTEEQRRERNAAAVRRWRQQGKAPTPEAAAALAAYEAAVLEKAQHDAAGLLLGAKVQELKQLWLAARSAA